MTKSCWAGVRWSPLRGRVHKSVVASLYPRNISLPLKVTTHLSTSKVTIHPTSVRTLIPKSDAMDSSGMICPVNIIGRPGMSTSHICVDITRRPSARATLRGQSVGRLFLTGVPSMMNICVAPESAIATCVDSGIAAWAKSMVSGGEITVGGDTLEATSVTTSSS